MFAFRSPSNPEFFYLVFEGFATALRGHSHDPDHDPDFLIQPQEPLKSDREPRTGNRASKESMVYRTLRPMTDSPRLDRPTGLTTLVLLGPIRGLRGFQPAVSKCGVHDMMKNIHVAAAVALALSSVSFAQQAVQWRVEDGGNGHWYRVQRIPGGVNWSQSRNSATAVGGDLPTPSSTQENDFIISLFLSQLQVGEWGPFIGGVKSPSSGSICPQWSWVTGEPFNFLPDFPPDDPVCGNCAYGPCPTVCQCFDIGSWETVLQYWRREYPVWNSAPTGLNSPLALTEWSADCNNDGVVDYGQIVDGTFADANGNGVPDCCDQGSACAPCARADFFRDFNVNGADLGILLSQWGPNTPLTVCDLTRDGVVNGDDLGIFLSYWGPCP